MIPHYADHAANERTFLAWIRTGIAVAAFGIVIERFNLFLAAIADGTLSVNARSHHSQALISRIAPNEGLILTLIGLALIVIATLRFVRTARRLDSQASTPFSDIRVELALSLSLVLAIVFFVVYLGLR